MHGINVAIVGCGYVANGHLAAWRKVHSARVVAVSDLNETLAKSTAETWKIPHYCGSLSELIELGDIDVVDICTPPQTHAALSVQAMEAGFNAVIEKPMAMTTKDAEEIVRCQKTTGAKAGVIHNWLFDAPVLEASSLVKKGYLGEVLSIDVEVLSTKDDSMAANEHHWCHSLPGGRFSEMLAHPIYLTRHFLGDVKIRDVQVSKIGGHPWMKSDELCATFGAGNKFGRAYVSFNSSRDAIFVNLYGEEGIIRLEIINATVNVLPRREASRFGKGFDSLRQAAQLTSSTVKNAAKILFGRWSTGHDTYIKLFTESLSGNREIPVSVEEGLKVVKTLEETCSIIDRSEKNRKNTT